MKKQKSWRGLKKILELEREMRGVKEDCDYLTEGKVWWIKKSPQSTEGLEVKVCFPQREGREGGKKERENDSHESSPILPLHQSGFLKRKPLTSNPDVQKTPLG